MVLVGFWFFWIISVRWFICHVRAWGVIVSWWASSVCVIFCVLRSVLSMFLGVLCLSSAISCIVWWVYFLVWKYLLYLPSRMNVMSPAFVSTPRWNWAKPIDMPSWLHMPLNWMPGLAWMKL